MWIKVNGKEKALKDLEKAQKLIKEAESILYHVPLELGLEIRSTEDDSTSTDSDIQEFR